MGERIARVEVGRFDYPLVGEFKFFKAGARPSLLVRLTDASGVQGWGQSVPVESWSYETPAGAESTLREHLAGAATGADPADLPEAHPRLEPAICPSSSGDQLLAKAATGLGRYGL